MFSPKLEQFRNIISEPSSNEPGHKRMRIEDYMEMLNAQYGEMVAQQARLLRLLEAAEDRFATIVFQLSELAQTGAAGTPVPVFPAHKPIPQYGRWRSVDVVSDANLSNASGIFLMFDYQDLLPMPNAKATLGYLPLRLLKQYETVGVWYTNNASPLTLPVRLNFSTRPV